MSRLIRISAPAFREVRRRQLRGETLGATVERLTVNRWQEIARRELLLRRGEDGLFRMLDRADADECHFWLTFYFLFLMEWPR